MQINVTIGNEQLIHRFCVGKIDYTDGAPTYTSEHSATKNVRQCWGCSGDRLGSGLLEGAAGPVAVSL